MRKIIVCVFIIWHLLNTKQSYAQADYIVGSSNIAAIENIHVLPDKNYTLQQVLIDSSLHFVKQEKISIKGLADYWAKFIIKNNSPYDEKFAVWGSPAFDNVLDAYNEDSTKWTATKGGHLVSNNTTLFKYMPVLCKGNAETVFYIKLNVTSFHGPAYNLKTQISIEKLSTVQATGRQNYNWWLVTIFIVLVFMIYNAYLYFISSQKILNIVANNPILWRINKIL